MLCMDGESLALCVVLGQICNVDVPKEFGRNQSCNAEIPSFYSAEG